MLLLVQKLNVAMYSSSHCCKLVKYSSKLFVWWEDYMQTAVGDVPLLWGFTEALLLH